ncbi:MAG: hypothetical protein ACFFFG_09070 [Candidatus Thorarchaeota archaeon]
MIISDMAKFKHIFRAYDIRGIYSEEITPDIHFRIGVAFGVFICKRDFDLEQDFVYVSYDVRQTSSTLACSFISGLMSVGVNIQFSGAPTQFGVCLFSAWRQKAYATAYITASHLPPEWNGIKFYYGSGVGFSEEDNMEIRDIFLSDDLLTRSASWDSVGQIRISSLEQDYVNFLSKRFRNIKPLKVVIDCGNGASCLSAPKVLTAIGLDVVKLYCSIDPSFPNRPSEPHETSLKALSQKVKELSADFGVAFDGDADRGVIVDDLGRIIKADLTGLILAQHMLQQSPKTNRVIINVECSIAIEKELESQGALVDRIQVGHTFLTAAAQRHSDTLIGIESSGHMVFPGIYLFDDAMVIPLMIAEILSSRNIRLSTIVDQLPKLFTRKIAVPVSDLVKFEVIDKLLRKLRPEYSDINDIDGIGISLDEDSWVLIRASNTSPKIRIIAEGKTEAQLEETVTFFKVKLEEQISGLSKG